MSNVFLLGKNEQKNVSSTLLFHRKISLSLSSFLFLLFVEKNLEEMQEKRLEKAQLIQSRII